MVALWAGMWGLRDTHLSVLKCYRVKDSIEVQGSVSDLMEPSSEMGAVEVPTKDET